MTVPVAQLGIPGVQELVVVVMIFLLTVAVPVVAIVLLFRLLRGAPSDERVRELEREVAELRGRLDERERKNRDDE